MKTSTFRLTGLVVFVSFIVLAFSTGSVSGQDKDRETLRGAGKIKGVKVVNRTAVLHIVTEKGDQYLVKPPEKPKDITYTGSADPSWLQPGMFVRLTAEFNKKGQAQSPIDSLTMFTPREDTQFGVRAEVGAGGDLFADNDKKPKDKDVGAYFVAGKLTSIKNGKISVQAGNVLIKGELAEDAKVSINVGNISLAQEGDSVFFTGWYYPARNKEIYATTLTVESSATLGEKKRKPPAAADEEKKEVEKKDDDAE